MEAKGGGARGTGRAAGAFKCHSAGQLSELRSPFPQDEITEGFSQPTSGFHNTADLFLQNGKD